MNHSQTIGGLDTRALEAVVENWIFVCDEVQFRGVLHDFDADVAGVFFREQGVGIVDGAGQDASEYGEAELARHQPPQAGGDRFVGGEEMLDDVDDELGDPDECDWQE